MSKQKQRWSIEEKEALSDGVERYGHGKWKLILSDPQFASTLANRSNIDLKDKWRNLNVCGNGSSAQDKSRSPMKDGVSANPTFNSPEPSTAVVPFEFGGNARPSRSSRDREASVDYKALILEAVSSIEDPNGPDLGAILNFIEDKYDLPGTFETSVTKKLRRLVLVGEIKKVNKRYKVKGSSSGAGRQPEVISITALPCDTGTSSDVIIPKPVKNLNEEQKALKTSALFIPQETHEDAARVAAHAIAVAERLYDRMLRANEKEETLKNILEDSAIMLEIAKDIHMQCLKKKMVLLNS